MQDMAHSKRRNRMADCTVQHEMMIKFNQRALTQPSLHAEGHWEEIGEDFAPSHTSVFLLPGRNSDVTPDSGFDDPLLVSLASAVDEDSDYDEQAERKDGEEENLEAEESDDESGAEEGEHSGKNEREEAPVQRFIREYVKKKHITAQYRWTNDKRNELEGEVINYTPRISVQTLEVLKMIKAYVADVEDDNEQ